MLVNSGSERWWSTNVGDRRWFRPLVVENGSVILVIISSVSYHWLSVVVHISGRRRWFMLVVIGGGGSI